MKSWFRSEDVLAVLLGLLVVALSLSTLAGVNLLGWSVSVKEWADVSKAMSPSSPAFASLTGPGALAATFAFLLVVLSAGAAFLGVKPGPFAVRFAVLFVLAFACWIAGHNSYIAATPNKRQPGIDFSLGLTGEAGYLLALVGGLLIGNLSPRAASWFKDAARSELFIKTGIVIYGAVLGAKAAEESGRTSAILFRGLAAIIEAYLIYWALVYLIARKVFGFSREWAAPLASGISICGVTAAITTGAAIRARPVVPVMVSSLVVVFAVIEMLVLPGLAHYLLPNDPMVAAGWMGLAVKTDGAAFSSGEITAAYFYPDADDPARKWMALTTTTVKVFIDVFIGVWAVILSAVWSWKIEPREGGGLPLREIWSRFPKFVFGYALTFGAFFVIGWLQPALIPDLKKGTDQADVFRRVFFVLTFFSIGLATNVRRLWAEGLGRLALVYVVSLFGFVIWIGLAISWLFFHGVPAGPGGK
ncbi:putative sulfate exporter family transporter [Limnoglobus roseus]|uniref:Putative sulfate exporter family transporter n=1 Tax=Limnoglobus roseus TaxID=2598579 RepID=A0A5C1A3Z9_9BACT|nr:putative sulfate exporter family transporter [Limnoglobus roseus]QEL13799.1 putative sulfate exporter family transporter [Limnoglobus roseus]